MSAGWLKCCETRRHHGSSEALHGTSEALRGTQRHSETLGGTPRQLEDITSHLDHHIALISIACAVKAHVVEPALPSRVRPFGAASALSSRSRAVVSQGRAAVCLLEKTPRGWSELEDLFKDRQHLKRLRERVRE